jgi:hypothetical protein
MRKGPGSSRTAKNDRAIDDNQVNSPWFRGGHHCGALSFVSSMESAPEFLLPEIPPHLAERLGRLFI